MVWNPLQYLSNASTNATPTIANSPLQLRIITHNIRYATSEPFKNERPWPERFPLILNQLEHELRGTSQAAFVCLQEVLHGQLTDILAGLNSIPSRDTGTDPPNNPSWVYTGVGRDDGKTKGEYSPILYDKSVWSLVHSETVWLSPTPDEPSLGWDAGSIRLLTLGVFDHIATNKRLVAANTHLDNAGSKSRYESVGIILSKLKESCSRWTSPSGQDPAAFLSGDFNSMPTQEAYQAMKEDGYMRDIHDEIKPEKHYGDIITFTGFEPEKDKDEQGRIDFIWLGPASAAEKGGGSSLPSWTVEGYAVLPNIFEGGVYLSDHRAVVGDLLWT